MSEHHETLRSARRGWLLNTTRGALAAALGTKVLLSVDEAAEAKGSPEHRPSQAKPQSIRRTGRVEPANQKVKTILGVGAHYDDCVFGIPGTLLKAVKKNYRAVVLSLIGDYGNWKPAQGRSRELVEGTIQLGKEYGVEMRFLPFAGMKFQVNGTNERLVAEALADVSPDIAFLLWPHDNHPDHEVASALSRTALGYADRLLDPGAPFRPPRRMYHYDNGPRHTIGFEPDTFIDITEEWPNAIQWLGRLMALVRREPFDASKLDSAQRAKEALALYRGQACGVRYAEAVRGVNVYPSEVF
jgi:LmbE family N-acetylglucosaminyl deacetylase